MNSSSFEPSKILNRIIDKAADNLRIAKILVQLGLDPDNITRRDLQSSFGNLSRQYHYCHADSTIQRII